MLPLKPQTCELSTSYCPTTVEELSRFGYGLYFTLHVSERVTICGKSVCVGVVPCICMNVRLCPFGRVLLEIVKYEDFYRSM